MKKAFILFFTSLLLLTGCRNDYLWNQYEELKKRVEELEALCDRLNSDISSLEAILAAVENNVTIKETAIIEENGMVIGYLIRFSDGKEVKILNGKNGKDGEDGEALSDLSVPVVSIRQDEDGQYYWTVNGEWLLNEYGQKIKAIGANGADGLDGIQGEDGTSGKDGITPRLKIEEGVWYYSLDEGQSWVEIGPAQGDAGAAGTDGTSLFDKVDISNPDYVTITLTSGVVIKVPTWKAFTDLQNLCNQMNENLAALQVIIEALQSNDYVESVTPLYEDALQVGYTIVFSQKGSVEIRNGKDGQSAVTPDMPKIGVRKDVDEVYYWTLDGEWILDEQGAKVRVEGADGATGEAGKDGVSPQLKIVDGYWYLSMNGGETWESTGNQAVGGQGAPGAAATPFFKEIRKDEKNMYIELADGTVLTLPLASDYLFNKIGSVTYIPRYADGAALMLQGASGSPAQAELDFLVAPAAAVADISESWQSLLKMKAYVREAGSVRTEDLAVTAFSSDVPSGVFTLTVSGEKLGTAFFAGKQTVTVVLQLTDGKNGILSEEISLVPVSEKGPESQLVILYSTVDNQPLAASETSNPTFWSNILLNEYNVELSQGILRLPLGAVLPASAFKGIENLATVMLDDRISVIEEAAFDGCVSLWYAGLPAGLEKIGKNAFRSCSKLSSVDFPAELTELGNGAFRKCEALKAVTLPSGIGYVGHQAFGECPLLVDVYCPAMTPPAVSDSFDAATAELKIHVPTAAVETYRSNYWWKALAEKIVGHDFN